MKSATASATTPLYGGVGNDTLRGGFDNNDIWGGPDNDLIDCAYKKVRGKGEAWDTAHTKPGDSDRVVDCLATFANDDKTS